MIQGGVTLEKLLQAFAEHLAETATKNLES